VQQSATILGTATRPNIVALCCTEYLPRS